MSKTARPKAYTAIQKSVGERMAWVRELTEPNAAEAARLLDVDRSTIAKVENGTRAPSIFLILGYANRFRGTADFFLRGDMDGLDGELSRKLSALHPALVLGQEGMGTSEQGTDPAAGKSLRPRKRRQASVKTEAA